MSISKKNRKRGLPIALLLFICLLLATVAPSVYSEHQSSVTVLRTMTREIMQDITGFRFSEADEKIALLEEEAPGSYYTAFAVAYRQYWRFLLYPYLEKNDHGLESAAERAIILCKEEEIHDGVDATIFRSCSHFFMAMLRHQQKRHLASLVRLEKGMQAISRLNVDEEDDSAGDIRILQGCFRYYRNRSEWRQAVSELSGATADGFYFHAVALLITAKIVDVEGDDVHRALEIYTVLSEQYPQNSLFLFFAAKCKQRLGMYEESLIGYRAALESIRYSPSPVELLCRIHFSAGQIFEYNLVNLYKALREYSLAYQWADPAIPETREFLLWSTFHLGQVNAKMGRKQEALDYLRKIRKQDDRHVYRKAQKLITRLTDRK
jgi:tetratricopeptide (TPR) repeat protein